MADDSDAEEAVHAAPGARAGWAVGGGWLLWPATLGFLVIWHLVLLPPTRALLSEQSPTLWAVLALVIAGVPFLVVVGLLVPVTAPAWGGLGWRVVWRLLPLAVVAGVLGESLLYPGEALTQGTWTLARVGRAAVALVPNGCVRAAVLLPAMVAGARLGAPGRVSRRAFLIALAVAFAALVAVSLWGLCVSQ